MLAIKGEKIDKGDIFDASKDGGLNVNILIIDALVKINKALKYFNKLPVTLPMSTHASICQELCKKFSIFDSFFVPAET